MYAEQPPSIGQTNEEISASAQPAVPYHYLTLAEGRCTVERSGDGGTVTLRLAGKIDEDGTPVEVCGTALFDRRRFGTDLPPGQIIPVPFENLAVLALVSRSEGAPDPFRL